MKVSHGNLCYKYGKKMYSHCHLEIVIIYPGNSGEFIILYLETTPNLMLET